MIVLRKSPCVRILEGCFIYPGLNGNIPDALAENESFKKEVELGIMSIHSKNKTVPMDERGSSEHPTPDRIDAIDKPDEDVIQAVLDTKKADAAVRLVKDILKVATVMKLSEVETRPSVKAALGRQLEILTKENSDE